MKKRVLEQRIRTAVEHAAPNQLNSILSSCDQLKNAASISANSEPMAEQRKGAIIHMTEKKKSKTRKIGLAAVAAVAAVFALCIGCLNLLPKNENSQIESVITLDVNPSLALYVDAGEKVLSVEALNDDAKEVLGSMELEGTSLEVAVNAIIGSMMQKGYLGDMQNSILVSVENQDTTRGEQLQQKVSEAIAAATQNTSWDVAILSQTVSGDDAALVELAKTYGISLGKAAMIQEVIAQEPALNFEDLVPMTINEIALIASSRDLTSDTVTQSGTASDKAYIGHDEALRQACAHAGVSVDDVQRVEVEFDSDDGVMIYEVEFEVGTWKYEYDIDARTGAVLKAESKEKGTNSTVPQEPTNGSTGSETVTSDRISESTAKAAALAHAGVSESSVYFLNCYLDYENGRPVAYEVEFGAGTTKYEYSIDLYTGTVLEYSTEGLHGNNSSGHTDSSTGTYIGESAALAAALNHAGVAESSLTKKEVELDEHGNQMVYEVEFEVGRTEYYYEVAAVSGEILKAECEQHD